MIIFGAVHHIYVTIVACRHHAMRYFIHLLYTMHTLSLLQCPLTENIAHDCDPAISVHASACECMCRVHCRLVFLSKNNWQLLHCSFSSSSCSSSLHKTCCSSSFCCESKGLGWVSYQQSAAWVRAWRCNTRLQKPSSQRLPEKGTLPPL